MKICYQVRQKEFSTATEALCLSWNSSGVFAPAIYVAAGVFSTSLSSFPSTEISNNKGLSRATQKADKKHGLSTQFLEKRLPKKKENDNGTKCLRGERKNTCKKPTNAGGRLA